MNMQEWRRQRAAKLASPDVLVPPAPPSPPPALTIVPQAAPPQEPVEPPITAQSAAPERHQSSTEEAPEATSPAPESTELERQVGIYLSTFRRVSYLQGQELREASGRLASLSHKINQLDPGFDWHGVWKREAVIDPQPAGTEWPDDAREAIAWLEELDVTTVPPFLISPSWPVPYPVSFFERLRRDVARGPRGPHAQQVAMDLQRVLVATREAIASGRRPSPAQLLHGSTQPTKTTTKHGWDAETNRRIAWLTSITPPAEPFRLDHQRTVALPASFIERLLQEVAMGPDSPRARTGAMQSDLAALELALSTRNTAENQQKRAL